MAKRVQVALTESIASLGKEGDLVEVSPGYARNFLLPYGKAMNVTPAVLKQIERKKEKEKIAADKLKQEALDFQTALSTIGRFTIKKQVGEDGVLFGTVTNGDVAEAIENFLHIQALLQLNLLLYLVMRLIQLMRLVLF